MRITNILNSSRELDENGYLLVRDCLLLHDGVMEYLGSELIGGADDNTIDGVKIDPEKRYRLNISAEELEKAMDSFRLIPIVNGHVFLGKDGENARDFQEGSVGENIRIVREIDEDGQPKNFLKATLKFTNPDTVALIESGEKTELSTSYSNELVRGSGDVDFEVVDIRANHLALVKNGRAGRKVRVANCEVGETNEVGETGETGEAKETGKTKENELTLTNNEETMGRRTKNAEIKPIEESNEPRGVMEEIRALLSNHLGEDLLASVMDEIGKIMESSARDHRDEDRDEVLDEENGDCVVRNRCANGETPAPEETEEKPADEEKTPFNIDGMYNVLRAKLENENKAIVKAYNEVKGLTGDFNFYGMNEMDIYRYALKNENIPLRGEETLGELKAMFRVYNGFCSKMTGGSSESKSSFKSPDFYL